MIFLTSISHQTDNLIINSWLPIGKIYSLNCQKEIDLLKDKFPEVTFIKNDESELNIETYGKAYINITSFIEFAQTLQEEVICILNADLEIKYDEKVFQQINQVVQLNNFVIAKRYNYTVDVSDAVQEIWGVDFFCMNQNILKQLPKKSKFMMGQCWWDYWLPTLILNLNIPIFKVESKILFHKKHKINWSEESWHTMGKIFYQEMGIPLKDPSYINYIDGMKVYHQFYDNAITLND